MSLDPALSRATFRRDGWKCRHCNDRNGLHPHHVVYKSHGGADDLSNLITLCWQCHQAVHVGHLAIEVTARSFSNIFVNFTRLKNWRPQ